MPCADKMRNRKLHRTVKHIDEKGQAKMRRSRKAKIQIAASILTGVFIIQQSMTLSAGAAIQAASGWSGVGTADASGVININPGKFDGNIGFQKYDQFVLDQGQTANLNFTNNIDTFVNLMNKGSYNINGIVNSVRNGNFYDGKAIFISPGGMVIGSSGLINVGSLSVQTLNSNYVDYLDPDSGILTIDEIDGLAQGGSGTITVNGKIMATNDISLRAANITVGSTGGLVAGIATNAGGGRTVYNAANKSAADSLFNNLVNTSNITSNSSYKNSSGNGLITIRNGISDVDNTQGKIDIAGKVVNYATKTQQGSLTEGGTMDLPNILVYQDGGGGLNISGTIAGNGGEVQVANRRGNATITNSAYLQNNGSMRLTNAPVNDSNTGQSDDVFNNTIFTMNGRVSNTGDLTIWNEGYGGLNIGSSSIENTGDILIQNGPEPNTGGANTWNSKVGELTISGTISNSNGNFDITNYATDKSGLNIQGTGKVSNSNGDMTITNYGAEGLNLANGGTVSGSASDITMNNYGDMGMKFCKFVFIIRRHNGFVSLPTIVIVFFRSKYYFLCEREI